MKCFLLTYLFIPLVLSSRELVEYSPPNRHLLSDDSNPNLAVPLDHNAQKGSKHTAAGGAMAKRPDMDRFLKGDDRGAPFFNELQQLNGDIDANDNKDSKAIAANPALLDWINANRDNIAAYERFKVELDDSQSEQISNSWFRGFKFSVEHMSMEGFWASFSMIVVSEIGDKTFFIAAILAMKHSRMMVFFGAASALALMTVLGVIFGHLLTVIPTWITHYGAGSLFLFFGAKLLYDARSMKGGEAMEELREVEEELKEVEKKDKQKAAAAKVTGSSSDLESQQRRRLGGASGMDVSKHDSPSSPDNYSSKYSGKRVSKWELAIAARAFVMTFVSEIGDRSQITTIVLAAHKNPWGVTFGATGGHALCTAIAVMGGKILATKISEKNVAIIGGILFLIFALECFIYGPV